MAQIWKITQNPPKPQRAEAIKTRMREISSVTIITPEVTSNIPTITPFNNESSPWVLGINAAKTENRITKAHIVHMAPQLALTELTKLLERECFFTTVI